MNHLISLKKIKNLDNGSLSFFEAEKDIPFQIKRIYFIYDVPNKSTRGFHAHKKLKQALWCLHGSIEVTLDDGHNISKFVLDSPEKLLIVEPITWREMKWLKDNSTLCVAVSEYYAEDDYIRNYDDFLKNKIGRASCRERV